jgi:hypothetical protein
MFTVQDREKCQRLFEKYYSGRKFFNAQYSDLIGSIFVPASACWMPDAGAI